MSLDERTEPTLANRYLKIKRFPLTQASWIGVDPLFALGFIFFDDFDKILKTAKFPLAAAQCNGVSPFLFVKSWIFVLKLSKYLIISVFPVLAAKWSKELPSISVKSGFSNQGTRKISKT